MTTVYDDKQISTVYLVPSPKTRAIRYIESIEKSGMIIDQKHAIAMFVSKSAASIGLAGPPGDPGVDANPFDTIIASASDEETPLILGGPKTTFRSPYPLDLSEGHVRISLTNAPVGAALIVDVTMNGASLFTVPVRIDAGMKTSVGSVVPAIMAITAIPDDAEFLVYVLQVGSTYAGSGLKVAVTGTKTE